MSRKVRSNKKGDIIITHDMFEGLRPNADYEIEQEGNALKLMPTDESITDQVENLQAEAKRLWTEASPEERVRAFREWLEKPRSKSPPLPEEAMHRESMYD